MTTLADDIIDNLNPDVVFTLDDHTDPVYYHKSGTNLPTLNIAATPIPTHNIPPPLLNPNAPTASEGSLSITSYPNQVLFKIYTTTDRPKALQVNTNTQSSPGTQVYLWVVMPSSSPFTTLEVKTLIRSMIDPHYPNQRPKPVSLGLRKQPQIATASLFESSYAPLKTEYSIHHMETGILNVTPNNTEAIQLEVVTLPATYPKSYTYSFDLGTNKTLTIDSATSVTVDAVSTSLDANNRFLVPIPAPATDWARFDLTDPLDFVARVKVPVTLYPTNLPGDYSMRLKVVVGSSTNASGNSDWYAGTLLSPPSWYIYPTDPIVYDNPFTMVFDYTSQTVSDSTTPAGTMPTTELLYFTNSNSLRIHLLSDDKIRIYRANTSATNMLEVSVPTDTQVLALRRNADDSLDVFSDGVLTDTVADFSLPIPTTNTNEFIYLSQSNPYRFFPRGFLFFDKELTDTEIAEIASPTQDVKQIIGEVKFATSGDIYVFSFVTGLLIGSGTIDASGNYLIDNFDFHGKFLIVIRSPDGIATHVVTLGGANPTPADPFNDGLSGARSIIGVSKWMGRNHAGIRFLFQDDDMTPLVRHESQPLPYTIKTDYMGAIFMVEVFDDHSYHRVIPA